MNAAARTMLYSSIPIVAAVFGSLLVGGLGFIGASLSALLRCAPLLLICVLTWPIKPVRTPTELLILSALLGTFIFNAGVNCWLLWMYAPGILESKSLGPAEGYWLLISWGIAVKVSAYGAATGALVVAIYAVARPRS